MQRVRAGAPGGMAHVPVLLVDPADSEAAPVRLEPIAFDDARRASPIFRPSPRPFRAADRDLQTKSEPHQEIHRQTKYLHWCPACRRTSQIRAAQNDSVQQPFVGANG